MSFTISDTVTCDLLPDDGGAAEQRFLSLLGAGHETVMVVYAFTLKAMVAAIEAASSTKFHIYADHSQAPVGGKDYANLKALAALPHVEVTIGTSNAGKAYICHDKALTNANGDCFVGSCNFSETGWKQVNAIFEFNDLQYARNLAAQYNVLVQYAWADEAALQVRGAQPPPVSF